MAWNEPGGAGNKDPWGNRKNTEQQGPPDLDEVVRKLQQRLRGLFGGKGPGVGGGEVKPSRFGLGALALIALIIWLLSGIYIIDPAERGVVQRFGKYVATTLPGPHWHMPYPIEAVEKVNVEQIRNVEIGFRSDGLKQNVESVSREALMLTQDENIVDVRFSIQYRIKDAPDYLFNVRDPDFTLVQATESVVREVIGKSKMDFVLTEGRSEIAANTEKLTQAILDRYNSGLQVTSVNMQNAQPPEEVQDAFQDVVRSREDEQRLKNEAESYANDIIPRARGAAARMSEEANAYKARVIAEATGDASRFTQILQAYQQAPDVTRERLYLETMESVMSNTNKIMVDVPNGNNLLYLPLDRLTQRNSAEQSNSAPPAPAADAAAPLAPEQKNNDLRDRDRTRGER